jgi:hypothetical protein
MSKIDNHHKKRTQVQSDVQDRVESLSFAQKQAEAVAKLIAAGAASEMVGYMKSPSGVNMQEFLLFKQRILLTHPFVSQKSKLILPVDFNKFHMTKSLHTLGLIACGMRIAAGTAFYFILEIMKETCVDSPGAKADKCPKDETRWSRPFFSSALLFFGMAFSLVPFFWFRYGKEGVTKLTGQVLLNLLIPTLLELVGQTMFMMGVLYIPMSLSLTLKGSRVVFSAVLLVVFLKRKLFSFHWFAVIATIAGLCIASIPALIKPSGASKTMSESLTGIALVLGGEFIRSLRTVVEEKLMKKMRYDALLVVGLQGFIGFMLSIPTLFVVTAIKKSDDKPLEDIYVTIKQFASNGLIYGFAATFPFTVSGLFISGAFVTKLMSAVHNALTSIITSGIVWVLTIVIHFIDPSRGTELELLALVQLLGFVIVLLAALVYDAIIRLPFFTYPLDRAAASGAGSSEKSVLGITESFDNTSESTKADGEDNNSGIISGKKYS